MAPSSGDKSSADNDAYEKVLKQARLLTDDRKLVIASNRGPLSYSEGQSGQLVAKLEASRGFETFEAITDIPVSWVTSAVNAADRKALKTETDLDNVLRPDILPNEWSVRFVAMPRRVHHKFYNVICNPLLWFLLHRSWSPTFTPNIGPQEHDAWERGYKAVNESFASSITEAVDGHDLVLVCRDYQLMLVSGLVREKHPNAAIYHSFETPWPWPSDFEILPSAWRIELIDSLLKADVISFPSSQDIDAFIACVQSNVTESKESIDENSRIIEHNGNTLRLAISTPPVRTSKFNQVVEFESTQRAIDGLNDWQGDHTFATVDRAEPHKNIVRSISAFGELLKRRPDLSDKVRYLLFLTPGPAHISAYKRLSDEIRRAARRVNDKAGNYTPVQVHEGSNFYRSVAALAVYDTLVSVPIVDGVGRSVLDGPLVNSRNGGMVLSETSSSSVLLKNHASVVGFSDIDAISKAMELAVAESDETRSKNASSLRTIVKKLSEDADGGRMASEIIASLNYSLAGRQ